MFFDSDFLFKSWIVYLPLIVNFNHSGNAISFIVGLVLNIAGSGIGYLKCEIDRELINIAIDKKFEEYGILYF